jgi:hypothetical protein
MHNNGKKTEDHEDDGEGEGGGNGGNPGASLTPSFGEPLDDEISGVADEEKELECDGVIPADDDYPLSVNDLVNEDELPNGMVIGEYDGLWFVFDGDERFGPFQLRETAVKFAYSRRSCGPSP